jgi:hypothetical protein
VLKFIGYRQASAIGSFHYCGPIYV